MRYGMSLATLGLAALLAGAALAGAAGGPRWQPFTSGESSFSILLPGTPKVAKKPLQSSVGPVTMTLFTVETNGGATAYVVGYVDYPADGVAKSDPKKLLDEALAGE